MAVEEGADVAVEEAELDVEPGVHAAVAPVEVDLAPVGDAVEAEEVEREAVPEDGRDGQAARRPGPGHRDLPEARLEPAQRRVEDLPLEVARRRRDHADARAARVVGRRLVLVLLVEFERPERRGEAGRVREPVPEADENDLAREVEAEHARDPARLQGRALGPPGPVAEEEVIRQQRDRELRRVAHVAADRVRVEVVERPAAADLDGLPALAEERILRPKEPAARHQRHHAHDVADRVGHGRFAGGAALVQDLALSPRAVAKPKLKFNVASLARELKLLLRETGARLSRLRRRRLRRRRRRRRRRPPHHCSPPRRPRGRRRRGPRRRRAAGRARRGRRARRARA